jgi:hypothetical protein
MIFELDVSFDRVEDWSSYADAVHALLESHRLQKNLFVASKATLNKMCSAGIFGSTLERTLQQIIQKYADYASLSGNADRKVLVYDYDLTNMTPRGRNIVAIDISYFSTIQVIEPFLIVVEHQANDGILLSLMIDAVAKEINVPVVACTKVFWHGGGSTICEQIEYLKSMMRPFYVVVDSDKAYPGDTEKSTAQSAKNAVAGVSYEFAEFVGLHVTSTREIENLIPIEIFDRFFSDSDDVKHIQLLRRLIPNWPQCSEEEKNFWRYVDLKCGVNLEVHVSSEHELFNDAIRARIGLAFCPGISIQVAMRIRQLATNGRAKQELAKTFNRKLPTSPFWEELRKFLAEILWASVRNPWRV